MTIFGIIFFGLLILGLLFLFGTSDESDGILAFFETFVTVLFVSVIVFGFGSSNLRYEKDSTFGVRYISSLSVNTSVGGRFFLGSGSIDNKDYYYYVFNSKKGYQVSKIEANENVYVKEDGDTKPFIEYTKNKTTHVNWFGRLFFKKSLYDHSGDIIIHVPKNTIIKSYDVDVSKL